MLEIVSSYSVQWRYQLNAQKSAILVFGESAATRARNRSSRQWLIGSEVIPERDTYHHLGVLRSVSSSSKPRTSERCSSSRRAFFSLNALGSRAGCLHPLTSLRLYKVYCLPILLYGCEVWSLTQAELMLLERTHWKILRTITGLPIRCKSLALQQSLGIANIRTLIHRRQLNFLHSFSTIPHDSLPRIDFEKRLSGPLSPRSSLSIFQSLAELYDLPSFPNILNSQVSRAQWKVQIQRITTISDFSVYADECVHLPLSSYLPPRLGKPYPHWQVTLGFPLLSRENISRMKLLLNCYGLASDVCRFQTISSSTDLCPLCNSATEDAFHLFANCPALAPARGEFALPHPLASERVSDPARFVSLILGTEWLDDTPVQHACIEFLHHILSARTRLLS